MVPNPSCVRLSVWHFNGLFLCSLPSAVCFVCSSPCVLPVAQMHHVWAVGSNQHMSFLLSEQCSIDLLEKSYTVITRLNRQLCVVRPNGASVSTANWRHWGDSKSVVQLYWFYVKKLPSISLRSSFELGEFKPRIRCTLNTSKTLYPITGESFVFRSVSSYYSILFSSADCIAVHSNMKKNSKLEACYASEIVQL